MERQAGAEDETGQEGNRRAFELQKRLRQVDERIRALDKPELEDYGEVAVFFDSAHTGEDRCVDCFLYGYVLAAILSRRLDARPEEQLASLARSTVDQCR